MLRDLNGWVGGRLRVGITDGFRVPGENDNGRRLNDFCVEKGLRIGNRVQECPLIHQGG